MNPVTPKALPAPTDRARSVPSEAFAADWDDDPRIREEGDLEIELTYGYNISLGCRYHNRFGFGGWQPGHRFLRPKRWNEINNERPVVMVAPRTSPSGNQLKWVQQHWIPGFSNVADATKFDSRDKSQILFTDGSVRTIDRKEAESMGPEHYRVPQ